MRGVPDPEHAPGGAGTTWVCVRPSPQLVTAPMLNSCRWSTNHTFILTSVLAAAVPVPREMRAQDIPPDASTWTVAPQPSAIFGRSEDGLGGMFAGIVDVARARDGTIVVAESQSSSVTFFSPDGALVATRGRQGEGPGEFSRMSALLADPEGRLFVFDEGHQRISEFTLAGDFVAATRLVRGADNRPIGGIGQYEDGGRYAWEADRMTGSEMGEMAQDTVGYYKFADGEVGDVLARVPGTITTHFEFQGRGSLRHALLTPHPLGAPRGQCLLVGTSDTPALRVLDRMGAHVGEVALDIEVDRSTDEHREEWVSATLAKFSGIARFIQRFPLRSMSRRVGMADWVPFADRVVVDDLGYIWAQRFEFSGFDGSAEWRVFTEAGTAVGTVTLPEAMQVTEISADAILGFDTDEHEQQDVRIYALDRGRDIEPRPPLPGCD